jgi:hypothetical protein
LPAFGFSLAGYNYWSGSSSTGKRKLLQGGEPKRGDSVGNLPEMICNKAHNLLFERAINAGDRFRQWFYPDLPKSYNVNPQVDEEIEAAMLRGLSAQQIADLVYSQFS